MTLAIPPLFLLLLFSAAYCRSEAPPPPSGASGLPPVMNQSTPPPPIDTTGKTLRSRFPAPPGFERTRSTEGTFAHYLRHLPLRPHRTPVRLYDGSLKANQSAHVAVIDLEIGRRNLQQCADAIIRLRAEYLWHNQRYDQIGFHFTNGFFAPYANWRAGQRIRVQGNDVTWHPSRRPSDTYATFRRYLDMVFAYAGTISLRGELKSRPLEALRAGDVFVEAGSPGHAVLVVDTAINPSSGETVLLLAQSYMPAQDIHLLANPGNPVLSPWYALDDIGDHLRTPEWTFPRSSLKKF